MEQYDTLVQKIAKVEGEMMIAKQKVSEAINGISSDPLISFDAELMKMCNNLNKYFAAQRSASAPIALAHPK